MNSIWLENVAHCKQQSNHYPKLFSISYCFCVPHCWFVRSSWFFGLALDTALRISWRYSLVLLVRQAKRLRILLLNTISIDGGGWRKREEMLTFPSLVCWAVVTLSENAFFPASTEPQSKNNGSKHVWKMIHLGSAYLWVCVSLCVLCEHNRLFALLLPHTHRQKLAIISVCSFNNNSFAIRALASTQKKTADLPNVASILENVCSSASHREYVGHELKEWIMWRKRVSALKTHTQHPLQILALWIWFGLIFSCYRVARV